MGPPPKWMGKGVALSQKTKESPGEGFLMVAMASSNPKNLLRDRAMP